MTARSRRADDGFGLVEVLASALVLSLAVLGAIQVFSSALDRQSRDAREMGLMSELNYRLFLGQSGEGDLEVSGFPEPIAWSVSVETLDQGEMAGVPVDLMRIEARARWQENGATRERRLVREEIRARQGSR